MEDSDTGREWNLLEDGVVVNDGIWILHGIDHETGCVCWRFSPRAGVDLTAGYAISGRVIDRPPVNPRNTHPTFGAAVRHFLEREVSVAHS